MTIEVKDESDTTPQGDAVVEDVVVDDEIAEVSDAVEKQQQALYEIVLDIDVEFEGKTYKAGKVTGTQDLCEALLIARDEAVKQQEKDTGPVKTGKLVKVEGNFRHNNTHYRVGQEIDIADFGQFAESLLAMNLITKA